MIFVTFSRMLKSACKCEIISYLDFRWYFLDSLTRESSYIYIYIFFLYKRFRLVFRFHLPLSCLIFFFSVSFSQMLYIADENAYVESFDLFFFSRVCYLNTANLTLVSRRSVYIIIISVYLPIYLNISLMFSNDRFYTILVNR